MNHRRKHGTGKMNEKNINNITHSNKLIDMQSEKNDPSLIWILWSDTCFLWVSIDFLLLLFKHFAFLFFCRQQFNFMICFELDAFFFIKLYGVRDKCNDFKCPLNWICCVFKKSVFFCLLSHQYVPVVFYLYSFH